MALPLIDFRGKVTPETDAVLESILSPVACAVVKSRAIAFQTTEIAVIREVLEDWAAAKVFLAEHISAATAIEPKSKAAASAAIRRMPKRRREIFNASNGKCHYCNCELEPEGKWHIEHKMPKALMGTNDPSNLVAACVPCNLSKRDKTEQEFIALRVG